MEPVHEGRVLAAVEAKYVKLEFKRRAIVGSTALIGGLLAATAWWTVNPRATTVKPAAIQPSTTMEMAPSQVLAAEPEVFEDSQALIAAREQEDRLSAPR